MQNINQSDTLFTLTCQEEDELGRLFDVSYRFNLKEKRCISYERFLPADRYWAVTLLEQIFLQEADPSGDTIDVDGKILNFLYTFDDYILHLSLKENQLVTVYIGK